MRQYQTFMAALAGYIKYGLLYAPERSTLLSPDPHGGIFYLDKRKNLHLPHVNVGDFDCLVVADFDPDQLQALAQYPVPDLFQKVSNG